MVEAIAMATGVAADKVRRAVMVRGDLATVAEATLAGGAAALDRFAVELFRPMRPMLAGAAEDTDAVLAELGEAAFEFKLDGARIQAHKAGEEVRVFSRRMNDVTDSVPEIVEAMSALPIADAILDGEAMSLQSDGRPQPFQVTMRRFGRKLDVAATRAKLPLRPYFFDCLRLDAEDLTFAPAHERIATLSAVLPPELIVPRTVTAVPSMARAFFDEALAAGHEGLMAKSLEGVYAAGARGRSWLKIKQATTLDLVVLAAEWGHGRRRGWLSNLHLGARDPENGGFVMLGKTFKGMTDDMLRWQTERLLGLEVARDAGKAPAAKIGISTLVITVEEGDVAASVSRLDRHTSPVRISTSSTWRIAVSLSKRAGVSGSTVTYTKGWAIAVPRRRYCRSVQNSTRQTNAFSPSVGSFSTPSKNERPFAEAPSASMRNFSIPERCRTTVIRSYRRFSSTTGETSLSQDGHR